MEHIKISARRQPLDICHPGVSLPHTISPIFTDERLTHYLRFRPIVLPLPPVEDDSLLAQHDSCLQGTTSRNSADPERGKP